MPIGKYVTYRCKKCGYTFTRFRGDVLMPRDLDVRCPKCGGEAEVVSSSIMSRATLGEMMESLKKIFKG